MELYNHSKCKTETATKEKCPRCKGFGSTSNDKGELCDVCNGDGFLWLSESGWTRPFHGRIGKSETLY